MESWSMGWMGFGESRRLLAEALNGATELITAHRDAIDRLVDALVQRETLEREELGALLDPKTTEAG
jgi:ATP-dependent Zn protease